MTCPRCQHPHFVKNGHINEKQRYKCKACNYQWTENHAPRGRPLAEKALAVFLYCHGIFHECHRKNASRITSTILEWIRNFGSEHAKPPEPQETDVVVLELDEMRHYLKKRAETLDLESFVS